MVFFTKTKLTGKKKNERSGQFCLNMILRASLPVLEFTVCENSQIWSLLPSPSERHLVTYKFLTIRLF